MDKGAVGNEQDRVDAEWVRLIYAARAMGVPIEEVRKFLIEGAKQ